LIIAVSCRGDLIDTLVNSIDFRGIAALENNSTIYSLLSDGKLKVIVVP
jgi:hypothetical protein